MLQNKGTFLPFPYSLCKFPVVLFHSSSRFCKGIIKQSIMELVNDFSLASIALCRKHIRVKAVPISFVAP